MKDLDKLYPIEGLNYICPVCQKEFKALDKHRFMARGGWTCSWECFLIGSKKQPKDLAFKEKEEDN